MKPFLSKWPTLFGAGLIAGAAIVYLDNWAFEGEVSHIVIVAMLLAATGMAGAFCGLRGGIAAAVTWATIPQAHVFKQFFELPDTLHPNTYMSIVYLAAFTLAFAIVGLGCGTLGRRLANGTLNRNG